MMEREKQQEEEKKKGVREWSFKYRGKTLIV